MPLCIVCFRARPPGVPTRSWTSSTAGSAPRCSTDGRVFAGTTVYDGRVALRPAIVNWRTTEADIDLFVDVVRELASKLA